jgi:hypothetical protein
VGVLTGKYSASFAEKFGTCLTQISYLSSFLLSAPLATGAAMKLAEIGDWNPEQNEDTYVEELFARVLKSTNAATPYFQCMTLAAFKDLYNASHRFVEASCALKGK